MRSSRLVGLGVAFVAAIVLSAAGASTASAIALLQCLKVDETETGNHNNHKCEGTAAPKGEYIKVEELTHEISAKLWCAKVDEKETGNRNNANCEGGVVEKGEYIKVEVPLFVAAKYPVEVEAKQLNDQGFQITGAVSVCKKAKFVGEASASALTLTVHPTYTECTVELAGTHTATVTTTGCNYLFHVAEPGTPEGDVSIVCESGKEIEVEVHEVEHCVIKIPAQEDLKTVEYINESGAVHVNANVTGIKWNTTAGCKLSPATGENGEYREGEINGSGIPVLGSGPAEALTKGFIPKTSEKINIEVEAG